MKFPVLCPLTFDIVPTESIIRAGIDELYEGDPVNVELSLQPWETRLGGHLVYGHVDANA